MTKMYQVQAEIPRCPACKVQLSMHAGSCMPEEGDISICAQCGNLALFTCNKDGEFGLRLAMSPEELKRCKEAVRKILQSDTPETSQTD